MMKTLLCIFLLASAAVQARTWTDNTGRKIEAELVKPNGDQVILNIGGKETSVPRSKLSKEDLDFVDAWKKPPLSLGGVAIEMGGKPNVIMQDYSPEALKAIKSGKGGYTDDYAPGGKKGPVEGETQLKLGIAVPADFDPDQAPKVMVVTGAVNVITDQTSGHFRMLGAFAKQCTAHGWVCITVDSNTGTPSSFVSYAEAFALLEKEWPGMAKARYATGGHSGGSKSCWGPVASLLKAKKPVIGVFMAGCNESYAAIYRKELNAPSAPYAEIKVFLSNGKSDRIAPASSVEQVVKDLKSGGVENIRQETYDGAHAMNQQHIDDALVWFGESK